MLVPLTPVETPATENAIKAKIDGLLPEGGTEIYKGLEAGVAAIEKQQGEGTPHHPALRRGQRSGNFSTLVPQLKREKITVATVALGAEADTKLLAEIAKSTGGNAYRTESPLGTAADLLQRGAAERAAGAGQRRRSGSSPAPPARSSPA